MMDGNVGNEEWASKRGVQPVVEKFQILSQSPIGLHRAIMSTDSEPHKVVECAFILPSQAAKRGCGEKGLHIGTGFIHPFIWCV